jgi:TP901 family phage tail tape measure protein
MGRTVSIKLLADVAGYMSGLQRAAVATKEFGGELDKAAKGGKVDKIAKATAVLGLGLVGVAAGAVKMSMDFDRSMSAVSAATHGSVSEMTALRQAAIQAGKDTQYSATEAADGITELAKAGVSTADILGGGLKGALALAAAGQLSVADAAQVSASAMTQFRLSGDQVPHVADLLAAAAGKAQGSVHDVGMALNQSGLVAAKFGMSIEDTTGVLAEFAHAGLLGSDAGTSLKTMFLAMANPVGQTADMMKQLGISFYDANGQFIGLSGVANVLQLRLRSLTQEQRNQALSQIFGNDAIRAASILYEDGAQGVDKWKSAVNDSGYASATAAKMTDNLSGDLERLRGSLETVAIESGTGANAGLRKLAQGAEAAVNAFGSLPGWIQQSITVLSGVGGISLLAAAGFLKARKTASDFMDELRDMGPRGVTAANGLSRIGSVAGKLGIAGAAAVGLYEGMKLFGDWVDHFSAPVTRDVDKMSTALQEFAASGKVTGELSKTFGADLQGLTRDMAAIAKSQADLAKVSNLANTAVGAQGAARAMAAVGGQIRQQAAQANADLSALDQTLASLVKNGYANQAKIAFQQLAVATGITIDKLPQYVAAANDAKQANTGLAKGFGSATANAETLKGSLDSATNAGQKLTDVWLQLHGALVGTDKAMLAANQGIQAVKQSFKDNGDAIKGNSDAALKNRIAIGDAAKAAVDAAQAKYEETGSVKQANSVYTTYLGQLRKTLLAAGLNKAEVDKLLGAYAKMPPGVATKINQPGMKEAIGQAQNLWTKLQGIDGNWVANLKSTGYSKVANDLRHLLAAQQALKDSVSVNEANRELGHFFSAGGWTGPGSKYQIAGVVHADEYVINKASRQKIETARPGLLDRINRTGSVSGYAGGGIVMPYPVNESKTKIPAPSFTAPGGIGGSVAQGGGPGYRWMEAAVRAAFPGMAVYSDYRPGAITLTGNRSYHSVGRAVDFAPSKPLAEWINLHFMRQTKELITPWQSLNIHNGSRHQYSALIENQHNFAGGNAHDHWAMAHGGMITEPIFGIGRSGRTYSFGENYQPERVVSNWHGGAGAGHATMINLSFSGPVGSQYELRQWLVAEFDSLRRKGRV